MVAHSALSDYQHPLIQSYWEKLAVPVDKVKLDLFLKGIWNFSVTSYSTLYNHNYLNFLTSRGWSVQTLLNTKYKRDDLWSRVSNIDEVLHPLNAKSKMQKLFLPKSNILSGVAELVRRKAVRDRGNLNNPIATRLN